VAAAGFPALPAAVAEHAGDPVGRGHDPAGLVGGTAGADAVLRRHLFWTLVLGLLFLGLQAWAWWQIWGQVTAAQPAGRTGSCSTCSRFARRARPRWSGPLAVVLRRALAGSTTRLSPGVRYCALYWHFLGAVWGVLFVAIYLV